jgi:hypothetical protein
MKNYHTKEFQVSSEIKSHTLKTSDRGMYVALIYTLIAERLSAFYEHHQWLTIAQGADLSSEWLGRHKLSLPNDVRRHLSALSDQLARQIAEPISREAGLYIAHEMMESLDPNLHSEVGQLIMLECEQILDMNPLDRHDIHSNE